MLVIGLQEAQQKLSLRSALAKLKNLRVNKTYMQLPPQLAVSSKLDVYTLVKCKPDEVQGLLHCVTGCLLVQRTRYDTSFS